MLRALMKKNRDGRFIPFLYGIMIIFSVLAIRLAYLQIVEGSYYRSLADGNRMRVIPITASRGVMYDRNGQILVGSRPGFRVSLVKPATSITVEETQRLASMLKINQGDIQEKIDKSKGSYEPVILAQDVGQDVVTKIEERRSDLPGVAIEVQPIRYYPYDDMAAQMFGYVGQITEDEMTKLKSEGNGVSGSTIIGRAGLEAYYDDVLRGKDGGRQVEVDATGRPVKDLERKLVVPGRNIHLTIDLDLQKAAEKAVTEQLAVLQQQDHINANAVALMAMDPNTGAVLAMVSRPSFNPNYFATGISGKQWNAINTNVDQPLSNKVISGQYPPGSTFKIVTGAAALELKKVTPEEQIFDNGRHWLIDMKNAGGEALGWISFKEALAKSDNVYFYEMGNRVGIDELAKYARVFGLGRKTGIALSGEQPGLVASEEYKLKTFNQDWYLGDTFNAAIGQGFQLMTPLQVAMVFSEVANGGIQYKPLLVSRVDNPDGSPYKIFAPEQAGTLAVSKANMDIIRSGLRDVTDEGGTASELFKNFPVTIAGKTGTAENFNGRDHGWFAAYAPFDKPRIVVVVLVEQGGYGVSSAGPIVRKVMEAFFHIETDKKADSSGADSKGTPIKNFSAVKDEDQ